MCAVLLWQGLSNHTARNSSKFHRLAATLPETGVNFMALLHAEEFLTPPIHTINAGRLDYNGEVSDAALLSRVLTIGDTRGDWAYSARKRATPSAQARRKIAPSYYF